MALHCGFLMGSSLLKAKLKRTLGLCTRHPQKPFRSLQSCIEQILKAYFWCPTAPLPTVWYKSNPPTSVSLMWDLESPYPLLLYRPWRAACGSSILPDELFRVLGHVKGKNIQ